MRTTIDPTPKTDTMSSFTKTNMTMVSPDTSVFEVYSLMKKQKIHHIPVVDQGKAVGIISDRDVQFMNFGGDALKLFSRDVMTANPYSVDAQTTIPHVVKVMSQKKINSVLIHGNDQKIIGIFTSNDALEVLADSYKN